MRLPLLQETEWKTMLDTSKKEQKVEDLLPYITESIRDGGQFVFFPKGTSMNPTIVYEKDCVVLKEPENLKKYDIVLYKRANGSFVLHRIIDIKNGTYTMRGDNQFLLENGISKEQIIAVVSEIRKQDKTVIYIDKIHSKSAYRQMRAKKIALTILNKIKLIVRNNKH